MEWKPLGATSPSSLGHARLQIHWAAQVACSLGKTFISPRADDSHPNFGFVPDGGLLITHPTETTPRFHVALSIPTNELLLLDENQLVLARLVCAGVTLEDAFMWLESSVEVHSERAVQGTLDRKLYDIPYHPIGSGEPFDALEASHLAEITAWYHNANLILSKLLAGVSGASDVRTWPHHFDIGGLVVLDEDGDAETSRSIGLGMTPGDASYDEPYFYVNPYPRPKVDLPRLEGGGKWHDKGWFGAVLTGGTLAATPRDQQLAMATSYLESAFQAATEMLQE